MHRISMDSSPLSQPDTPRTTSPALFDDDLNAPASPVHDDVQTFTTADDAPASLHAISEPRVTLPQRDAPREMNTMPLKGKERARKGPLRLLDLPVDILKEIIHQVST